jgi:hypothetical protein
MATRIREWLHLRATIGRVPYFLIGCALMFVKLILDRIVAATFGRPWTPFNYAVPGEVAGLFSLSYEDRAFFGAMLGVALPFVLIGVTLTIQRLRDARLPLWLVVLFFAPTPVNLLFYLLLSALPSRPATSAVSPLADALDVPTMAKRDEADDWAGAMLGSILLPVPFAVLFIWMGTHVFQDYGWGVFVGVPFALPMVSVILYGRRRPRPFGQCLMLGLAWLVCSFLGVLVIAAEGIICLIMALPLALPVVLLGASVGYLIQRRPLGTSDTVRVAIVLIAAQPILIGAEPALRPEAPVFAVRTAVEVDAPPEVVWSRVIDFPDLPPTDDPLLRTGIAFPVRARIDGRGVGAVRHCEFSTGPFVEPIEVWDEPHLLRFAVTSNPRAMNEWGLFGAIEAPHLDGFLVSRRGQFLLQPLPGGRTRLEGTTWYQHHLWPASYWRLWSDEIIHRIHAEVLRHVKRLAEDDAAQGRR